MVDTNVIVLLPWIQVTNTIEIVIMLPLATSVHMLEVYNTF